MNADSVTADSLVLHITFFTIQFWRAGHSKYGCFDGGKRLMQTPEEIYLYPPNSHKTLLSVHGTAPDLFLQQPRDELMIYLVYRLSVPFFFKIYVLSTGDFKRYSRPEEGGKTTPRYGCDAFL